MTPTLREVLAQKAQRLQRAVQRARAERAATDDFAHDFTHQDAALLNVQRACEQAIDMANLIVGHERLAAPEGARSRRAHRPGGDRPRTGYAAALCRCRAATRPEHPLRPIIMSAYIIADVDVTDPQQYEDYKRWSSAAIQAHGAEVLVRGGAVTVLEGNWQPSRIVVLRFASVQAAQAFYDSPEYRRAREARAGAAVMRMIAVQGMA